MFLSSCKLPLPVRECSVRPQPNRYRDSDERDFYKPTAECLAAVDAVLGLGQES